MHALRLWSSNYMEFATPLVACALLGPAAVHALIKPVDTESRGGEALHFLEGQILISVLKRFGNYWSLASNLQGMFDPLSFFTSSVLTKYLPQKYWIVSELLQTDIALLAVKQKQLG